MSSCNFRIGHGYDVHRFAPQRRLVLCGVEISAEQGLLGHSDADVAVHALMDAMLGAAAEGDIGKLFPDNAAEFKGISSLILLDKVSQILNSKGFRLVNADITIIAEKPKLASYINEMRQKIAASLDVAVSQISIKATTEEGLGLAGQGIGSHAVCLLTCQ